MTDNLRNNIIEAARMRGLGTSWSNIASTFQRSAETCRQWPRCYPDIWSAKK